MVNEFEIIVPFDGDKRKYLFRSFEANPYGFNFRDNQAEKVRNEFVAYMYEGKKPYILGGRLIAYPPELLKDRPEFLFISNVSLLDKYHNETTILYGLNNDLDTKSSSTTILSPLDKPIKKSLEFWLALREAILEANIPANDLKSVLKDLPELKY